MRLDRQNRLFVLEVNPNPDLTQGVGLIASAEAAGIPFAAALRLIVEEALKRRPASDGPRAEEKAGTPPGPARAEGGSG
jgi:D-alanine-D-alanine ligase